MASPGGFELPTFRLGGERSILLSYGDIYEENAVFTRIFGFLHSAFFCLFSAFLIRKSVIFLIVFPVLSNRARVPEISKSIKIDGIHSSIRTESRFCWFKFGDRRAITLGGDRSILLSYGNNYKVVILYINYCYFSIYKTKVTEKSHIVLMWL